MIWFLRIFSAFFIVLALATYSQNEKSLAQSTTTELKFEPALKVVLQSYGTKISRLPVAGEVLDGKLSGEDIKIRISEILMNEKAILEIMGVSHREKETIQLDFSEKENRVQINIYLKQKTKTDLLSRLVFLFFGDHSLKEHMGSLTGLLPNAR